MTQRLFFHLFELLTLFFREEALTIGFYIVWLWHAA